MDFLALFNVKQGAQSLGLGGGKSYLGQCSTKRAVRVKQNEGYF